MINASEAREDDEDFKNPVDLMFERLEEKDLMLSRLVDTFFSRTSWTMLPYVENHSISVA